MFGGGSGEVKLKFSTTDADGFGFDGEHPLGSGDAKAKGVACGGAEVADRFGGAVVLLLRQVNAKLAMQGERVLNGDQKFDGFDQLGRSQLNEAAGASGGGDGLNSDMMAPIAVHVALTVRNSGREGFPSVVSGEELAFDFDRHKSFVE